MISNENANFDDHLRAIEREGAIVVLYSRARSALRDQRLERSHRLVYAEMLERINSVTGFCFPSRQTIAERTGLALRVVENALYELRSWGYIDWERRLTEHGSRRLLHYTVPAARIDYNTLQEEIYRFRLSLDDKRTAPPVVQRTPQAVQTISTPPAVQNAKKYTAGGGPNCTAGGETVTNEKKLEVSEVLGAPDERARAKADGKIEEPPRSRGKPRTQFPVEVTGLGEDGLAYALAEGLTEPEAHQQFRDFRNHHTAKGNLMADWSAAWRTWVSNAKRFGHVGTDRRNGGRASARPSIVNDIFGGF